MDDGELQSHFLQQGLHSAAESAGSGGFNHGPYDNADHYTPMFDRNSSGTMLPVQHARADEGGRMAAMIVPSAETGGLSDPSMTNSSMLAGSQRHATTNEPPLPDVPSNTIRGKTGISGIIQDRARDHMVLLQQKNSDVHRALNSFFPKGLRLKEYQWNEGGGLSEHQGMGIRFNTLSAFNRYGRSVLPRDVPKKEPIPMAYDPRQERSAPQTNAINEAMRSNEMVPRVRDAQHSALAETDYSRMRGEAKNGGPMAADARPDIWVHKTRRDNPEPRVTHLQSPYVKADRTHALFSQDAALLRQRQGLDDGF
jgi:hypothetical protein